MKQTVVILAILILSCGLTAQTDAGAKQTKLNIRTAYVYKAEALLLSRADLYCSFMISPGIDESIQITGAAQQDFDRSIFSTGDSMYINRGEDSGIAVGDRFQVISKGSKIPDPYSARSLGSYFRYRGEVEVTCVFPERAQVKLTQICSPVEVGHFLVPYREQEPVFERSPRYTDCHIPETGATGRVVYLDLEQDIPREISARAHMISVTLGMDVVSRGDFLLFYKILNRKLPPIIIGTGIVLNPQNTNSTVKILGSSQPLEVGFYAILLPRAEAAPTPVSSEEIPILEKLKEKGEAEGESVSEFTTDVYFDLNGTEISDLAKSELQRAADFLEGKSEYMVILKGYTCSIGNEKYNLALSQKRVENIQKYMAETFSVGDDFFESHFYGEKESVFDNSVEVERRKNRRVSLKILAR